MISQNGLYTTIRDAIRELTDIEVYQNTSRKQDVVEAKWLFIILVYYLFDNSNDKLSHLKRPSSADVAFQLGCSEDNIWRLRNKYVFNADALKKLNILKQVLSEYTNLKISKDTLKEMLVQEKFNLTDVIDCVIELNSLIGVGLITLSDGIKEYIINKNK